MTNFQIRQDNKEKVGNSLKSMRTKNDQTQEQIAEILNIAVETYRKYEQGEILLPTKHLFELRKIWGLPKIDLFCSEQFDERLSELNDSMKDMNQLLQDISTDLKKLINNK